MRRVLEMNQGAWQTSKRNIWVGNTNRKSSADASAATIDVSNVQAVAAVASLYNHHRGLLNSWMWQSRQQSKSGSEYVYIGSEGDEDVKGNRFRRFVTRMMPRHMREKCDAQGSFSGRLSWIESNQEFPKKKMRKKGKKRETNQFKSWL